MKIEKLSNPESIRERVPKKWITYSWRNRTNRMRGELLYDDN